MFKCKLCNHKISYENLIDQEWGCGQCTIDDWEEIKPTNTKDKSCMGLEEYLKLIVDAKLTTKDKSKLIQLIGLTDAKGTLQSSHRLLNAYLRERKLRYVIIPKKDECGKYWFISSGVNY